MTLPVDYDSALASGDDLGGQLPGGNPHLFAGAWTDPVTGLSYLRARWYDARTAAFLQQDPEEDTDSPNLYAYVGLQPHAATDPTGRCMGLDNLECSDYFKELGGLVSSPAEIWASAKRSGGFAWNEVGGFVRAPFEAVSGVAELTGSLIGDPRGTTEGLLAAGMQLLQDPGGTLKAAGSGLLNADPAAAADEAGQILFDIAFTAGTGRVLRAPRMANALEDLARVSKLPKASTGRKITDAFEGSRLVRHADDIGRGARRIDAAEDAGHAARSLEKSAQGARHLDDGLGCHTWTRGIGAAMASFAPETPVATEDGLKPIQSISPGDQVWALNEKTGKRTLRKVLSTVLHLDDDALEMTAGGESFLTTADHPFFTASGEWVEAAKLKVGQEVQSLDGDLLRVEKVEKREGRFAVFNFEVDEDHSYFVGDGRALVHNCPVRPRGLREYSVAPHGTQPKPRSPLESHHIIQDAWARANIPGYKSKEAPSILLRDARHDTITRAQNLRSSTRRSAVQRVWGTSLRDEFMHAARDLRSVGVPEQERRKALKKAYRHFYGQ
jgi:RHS repeat-associated protein